MVDTLYHIAKSTLAYNFLHLVSETYLVTFLETVVAFVVIEAIVHKSFELCGLVLVGFWCHEPNFIIFFYLCALKSRQ